MILAKELLTAFEVYLVNEVKVGAGSARVYQTRISSFFRWHVGDSPTQEQLAQALAALRTVDPLGSAGMYSAWRHFRAFAVKREIMVPEAPAAPSAKRGRKPEGPPAHVIALITSYMTQRDGIWVATHEGLLKLTWNDVRSRTGRDCLTVMNVECRHNKVGTFDFSGPELINLFRDIQLWWGNGVPSKELVKTTPLFPAAPLSQQPMGIKAFKRAVKEGHVEAEQIQARWRAAYRARQPTSPPPATYQSESPPEPRVCTPPPPPSLEELSKLIPPPAWEVYKPEPGEFTEANEFALVPVVEEGDIGEPN